MSEIDSDVSWDRATRKPFVTYILCGLCVLMFFLQARGTNGAQSGISYPGYVDGVDLWTGEYWGLLTSFFLHAGITHIAFNLYWLYRFGKEVEIYVGWPKYLLFWIAGTAVSGMMQLVVSGDTGVGASGFVYALFGLIWVGRRIIPRWAALLDYQTVALFIIWMLLCFAINWMGILPIANWAHVGGFLFGCLCGYAFLVRNDLRWKRAVAAVTILSFLPLFYAPWLSSWNLAQAIKAYDQKNFERATVYLQRVNLPEYDAYTLELLIQSLSALGRSNEEAAACKSLISGHTESEMSDPGYYYNEYAWILATSPDDSVRNPEEAIQYAQKSCEETDYKTPDFLDTLAAAYASANQFDQALIWEQKAIVVESDASVMDELKAHLKLFQSQKPYREITRPQNASGGT